MKLKIFWTVVTIIFAGFGDCYCKYTGSRTELDKENEIYPTEIPFVNLTDNSSVKELEQLNLTQISAKINITFSDSHEGENIKLGKTVPESDVIPSSQTAKWPNDQILENLNSPAETRLKNSEIKLKNNESTLKDIASSQSDAIIDDQIIAYSNTPTEITLRENKKTLKDSEIALNENEIKLQESEIDYEKKINEEILSGSHPSYTNADPVLEMYSQVKNYQDIDSEFYSNLQNMDAPSSEVNLSRNEVWQTSSISEFTERIPAILQGSLIIADGGNKEDTSYAQLETSTLQSEMAADKISGPDQDYQIDSTEKVLLETKVSVDTENSIQIDNQIGESSATYTEARSKLDQEVKSQDEILVVVTDLTSPLEAETNDNQEEIKKDLEKASEAREVFPVQNKREEPIQATSMVSINLGSIITSVQRTEDTSVNNAVVESLVVKTTAVYKSSTALPQETFTESPKATNINTVGVTNLQDDLVSSDDTTIQPIQIHRYIAETLENINVTSQLSDYNQIESATEYNEPITVKFSGETSLSPTSSSVIESNELPNTDGDSSLNDLDFKISKDSTEQSMIKDEIDPLYAEITDELKLSPQNTEISNVKSVSKIEQESTEKAATEELFEQTFKTSDTEEDIKEQLKNDLDNANETKYHQNEDMYLTDSLQERKVETATEYSEYITVLSSNKSDLSSTDSSSVEPTKSRNTLTDSSQNEIDHNTESFPSKTEKKSINNAKDHVNEETSERLGFRSQNEESLNLEISKEKQESSEQEAIEGLVKKLAKDRLDNANEETREILRPTSRNEETLNLETLSKEEQESVDKDAVEGLVKQTFEILDIEKEVEELLKKELEEANDAVDHKNDEFSSNEYSRERGSETKNTTKSQEDTKKITETEKNSAVDTTIDPLTLSLLETKILDNIIKEISNADLTLTPVSSLTNLETNVPEAKNSAENMEGFTANILDTVTQSSLKITAQDQVNKFEGNVQNSKGTKIDTQKAEILSASVPETFKEILIDETNQQSGNDQINTVKAEEVIPDALTVESINLGVVDKSLEEKTSEIKSAILKSTEKNSANLTQKTELPRDAEVTLNEKYSDDKNLVQNSQTKHQTISSAEAIVPPSNDQSILQTTETRASESNIATNISDYSLSSNENNPEVGFKTLNTELSQEENAFEDGVVVIADTIPQPIQVHTYIAKSAINTNVTTQTFDNDQIEKAAEYVGPITALFSKDSSLSPTSSPIFEINMSLNNKNDSSPNIAVYEKDNISQRTLSKTTIDRPNEKGVEPIKFAPHNEELSKVKLLSEIEQESAEITAIEGLVNQAFGILEIEKEVKELLEQDLQEANQVRENQKLEASLNPAETLPEAFEKMNLNAIVLPSPSNLVENFVEEDLEDIKMLQIPKRIVENSLENRFSNSTDNDVVSKTLPVTKNAQVSDNSNQPSNEQLKSSEEEKKDEIVSETLPVTKSAQISDTSNQPNNEQLKSSEEKIKDEILSKTLPVTKSAQVSDNSKQPSNEQLKSSEEEKKDEIVSETLPVTKSAQISDTSNQPNNEQLKSSEEKIKDEILSKTLPVTKSAQISDTSNQPSNEQHKSSEKEVKDDASPETKTVHVSDSSNQASKKELKSSEDQIKDVLASQITKDPQNNTFTVVITEKIPQVTAINPNTSSVSPIIVQSEALNMDSLANISKFDHPSQPTSDLIIQPKPDVTPPRDIQPPDTAIEDLIEKVIETLNVPQEVEEILQREIEESFNPVVKTEIQEIERQPQETPVEQEVPNSDLKQNQITSNAEVNDILISNEILNSSGDMVRLQSLSAYAPGDFSDETGGGTFGNVLSLNKSIGDAMETMSEAGSGIVNAKTEDLVADVNYENSPGLDNHQVDTPVKNNAVSEEITTSSNSNAEQVAALQNQSEVEVTHLEIKDNQNEAVSERKEIMPNITTPQGSTTLEIPLNFTQINDDLRNNHQENLNEDSINHNTKVSGLEETPAQIATEVRTPSALSGPTHAPSNDVAVPAEKLPAAIEEAGEKLSKLNTSDPLSFEVTKDLETVSKVQSQSELGNPVQQAAEYFAQINVASDLSRIKEEPIAPKLTQEIISINFESQSKLPNPLQKETADSKSNEKYDEVNASAEVETTLDDVPRKVLTSSVGDLGELDNLETESVGFDSSKTIVRNIDHPSQPISDQIIQPKSVVTPPRDIRPTDAAIEDLIEQVIETLNVPEEVEEILEREIEESFNPSSKTESQEIEGKSQESPLEQEVPNSDLKQNQITSNAEVNDILISNEILNSGGDVVRLQSLSGYAPTELSDETEGGTFGHVLSLNKSIDDATEAISEASSGIVNAKTEDLVADVNHKNSPLLDNHKANTAIKNNAISKEIITSSSSKAEPIAALQKQTEVEVTHLEVKDNKNEAVPEREEIMPNITTPQGSTPLEIPSNFTKINDDLRNNHQENLNEDSINLNTKVSGLEETPAQIATEVRKDGALPESTHAPSNDVAVTAEKLSAAIDKAGEKLNELNTSEPLSFQVTTDSETVSEVQPQSELGNSVQQAAEYFAQINDASDLSRVKEEPIAPKLTQENISINFESQSSLPNPLQNETADSSSNEKSDQVNASAEVESSEVETTLDEVPRKVLTSSVGDSEELNNLETESTGFGSSKTPVQNIQSEIKEEVDKPVSVDVSKEIDDSSSKERANDDSSEQVEIIVRQDESAEESSSEVRYHKPQSTSLENVSKGSDPLEDTNDQTSSESTLSNAVKFFLESKIEEGIASDASTPKASQDESGKTLDQKQAAVIFPSPEINQRSLYLSEIDESPIRKVYQHPIYQGRAMLSEELIVPQSLQLAAEFVPTKVEFDTVGLEPSKIISSAVEPTDKTVKTSNRSFDDSQLNREDSTNNFMDAVVEAAELTTEMNRFIWTFRSSVAPNQEIPVSRPPSPRASVGAKLVEPRSITTSTDPYHQVASLNLTVLIAVSVTALFLLLALLLVLGNKIRSQNGILNIELAEQQMNSHITIPVTQDS